LPTPTLDAVTDELVDILVGPAQDRGLPKLFRHFSLKAMISAHLNGVKVVLANLKIPMFPLSNKTGWFFASISARQINSNN